jgi:hypothetical protein
LRQGEACLGSEGEGGGIHDETAAGQHGGTSVASKGLRSTATDAYAQRRGRPFRLVWLLGA